MWLADIRLGRNIYLYGHAGTRVTDAVERGEEDKERACGEGACFVERVTSREIV